MKNSSFRIVGGFCAFLAVLAFSSAVLAQDKQPDAPKPAEKKPADKQPAEKKPAEQPPAAKPGEKNPTLDNLMKAYAGEMNAHERYLAFAKKADDEGYAAVASLFRATAKAEEIHAKGHADVIKKLGGNARADVAKPEVKTTKENLETALQGETYEKDKMYPDFIEQAKKDKSLEAIKTFNYALTVEEGHAKLYKEALDNLASWKGAKKDFFVCAVCGNTVKAVDFEKCPVCYAAKDKYEKVN